VDPRELLLGRELVEAELLEADQLRVALDYQAQLPARLEDILVKLDFVDEQTLSEFLAQREQLPTIDPSGRSIDEELLSSLPRSLIEGHEVLPYRLDEETILLAMSDPADLRVIDELQFLTDCKIETALAPRSAIRERIERYYSSLPEPPPPPPPVEEQLCQRIADPAVSALVRVLITNGVVNPDDWLEAFEREGGEIES